MTAATPAAAAHKPGRLRPLALFIGVATHSGTQRLRYAQQLLIALEGKAAEASLRAFVATEEGAELAARQPDLLTVLRDRALLLACPDGSLGRRYADYLAAFGIDESYYVVSAPSEPAADWPSVQRWFRVRVDCSHDLRHVLTGYPPNDLGEICLLSFRVGQTGHRGALLLTLLGLLHKPVRWRTIREAFQRGRQARSVDHLAWEKRLHEPLEDVRRSVGLLPTRHFPAPLA